MEQTDTDLSAMRGRTVAVVGAGPVGLHAAFEIAARGGTPLVLERSEVAGNVRDWGHVRLFTPFEWNSSVHARAALERNGYTLPAADAILTGAEYADQYLLPLSQLPEIREIIREGTEVLAIGRDRFRKSDGVGNAARGEDVFRILVRDHSGDQILHADCVLDCSGTYPNHRWAGAGGIPCPGETDCLNSCDYGLPDVTGAQRSRFAARTTLVIGSGYSAATTIASIGALAAEQPDTRAVWITSRPAEHPIHTVADDPLPERRALAERANALAVGGRCVTWLSGHSLQAIRRDEQSDCFSVTIRDDTSGDERTLLVDGVAAHPGFRPNTGIYAELQVHECYASEGPMKLAAALAGSAADCLAQPAAQGQTLTCPEPGFFVLGSKSYGRNSHFLLRTGLDQVNEVLPLIAEHLRGRAGR